MPFHYTQHALAMLAERQIEPEWVEEAINSPDAVEADPAHADRTRAFRRIPERDGRVLRVVYVSEADIFRIITLFLDRGRRR
jgi:hypothetical protein